MRAFAEGETYRGVRILDVLDDGKRRARCGCGKTFRTTVQSLGDVRIVSILKCEPCRLRCGRDKPERHWREVGK